MSCLSNVQPVFLFFFLFFIILGKKAPIECLATTIYNLRGHPFCGGISTSGINKYSLIPLNTRWCSSFKGNSSSYFNLISGENTCVLLAKLEINLHIKLICLKKRCKSLFFCSFVALIALTLFLSTSIPF